WMSRTRGRTPWARGWCGVKSMVSVLISTSDLSARLALFLRGGWRLLVAGQHLLDALPRAQEVEAAEFLGELHRLVDDALLNLVPAHLDEAGQREILAQRMALEAVVGEDAAQVGMVGEPHAVEIVGLALEPAGGTEQPGGR